MPPILVDTGPFYAMQIGTTNGTMGPSDLNFSAF